MSAGGEAPEIARRFAGMGATAPDPVPPGEVWLDVGNRVAERVVDHHGGGSEADSTVELLFARIDDLVLPFLEAGDPLTVVVHVSPDLDAAVAAWLLERSMEGALPPEDREVLPVIVDAVSENDQGRVRTSDPHACWPIVVRTLLEVDPGCATDEGRLARIRAALDRTVEILTGGGTLEDAARDVATEEVRAVLDRARRDYAEDLARALVFQVRLPVREPPAPPPVPPDGPCAPPDREEVRWSLADGLFLDDPGSHLVKELARGDRESSPQGQGFPLLVVAREPETLEGRVVQRVTVSTDPRSGLHLEGLGAMLEAREVREEEDRSLGLLPGRRRVGPGRGRHGYDTVSPWYDGRGHDFTIVDSPVLTTEGRSVCATQLSTEDVLETLWEYGDPAAFAAVREARLTLFAPAERAEGWESRWSPAESVAELCPELGEAVVRSLGNLGADTLFAPGPAAEAASGATVVERLLPLPDGGALWIGTERDPGAARNLADLMAAVESRLDELARRIGERGLVPRPAGERFHLVQVRLRPRGFSMTDRSGHSFPALAGLARGRRSSFRSLPAPAARLRTAAVPADDGRGLLVVAAPGAVAVSVRSRDLAGERGFRHPDRLALLAALAVALPSALARLTDEFTERRATAARFRAGRLVLADRFRLMQIEQELCFSRVTPDRFGQAAYREICDALGAGEQLEAAKEKIESLARHVRGARSELFQQIAFWVSVLFAPLAITASFFSGTHMQREFARDHYTLLPADWQPAGWLQFAIVFMAVSAGLSVLWLLVRIGTGRLDPLAWLRRSGRGK